MSKRGFTPRPMLRAGSEFNTVTSPKPRRELPDHRDQKESVGKTLSSSQRELPGDGARPVDGLERGSEASGEKTVRRATPKTEKAR